MDCYVVGGYNLKNIEPFRQTYNLNSIQTISVFFVKKASIKA